jgi:hypothetical protein
VPPVDQDRLPASLLERIGGDGAVRVRRALELLAPITTRFVPGAMASAG